MAQRTITCPEGCGVLVTFKIKDGQITKVTKDKSVVQLDVHEGDPEDYINRYGKVRHGTWYGKVKHWIS